MLPTHGGSPVRSQRLGVFMKPIRLDRHGLCRAVGLQKAALAGQVQKVVQVLSRERLAEALREGGANVLGGAVAVQSGQQEVLFGSELERLPLEAVADQVGAVISERARNQLRPPAGEWRGEIM